mmetsp:Transcript_12583/g.25966  ORF Transcript_12583/g.25966 Transcript_12583/m.25966 type:complete len:200 (-) Transcript_12583:1514-2113(-)
MCCPDDLQHRYASVAKKSFRFQPILAHSSSNQYSIPSCFVAKQRIPKQQSDDLTIASQMALHQRQHGPPHEKSSQPSKQQVDDPKVATEIQSHHRYYPSHHPGRQGRHRLPSHQDRRGHRLRPSHHLQSQDHHLQPQLQDRHQNHRSPLRHLATRLPNQLQVRSMRLVFRPLLPLVRQQSSPPKWISGQQVLASSFRGR